MDMAINAAESASEAGEVPVGAVITLSGEIIAVAANAMRKNSDATAHAEMAVIGMAMKKLGSERLENCDLYVTLEPCTMCAGAISHARIRRLYFAAPDIKAGAVENGVRFFEQASCHHRPEVIAGIGEEKSRALLNEFFASRR
ncbi:tRNA-specific adenosine-34 deaminase [hydrothermal vent metagenome]|uniref:tRNA-specific adenosine deaminase 2 n=1 Tax=hydrothermal vent metagenome TaxID=652676 RepID=A0A3B0TX63_9ZZZZ